MGLNYPDEDYVRYYTRETVSWRALGWEGQAVLALMLHGHFDRSGIFDCDGHQPERAVTIVTSLPESVTSVGLQRLLDSKTWVFANGKIVWPNYVHAQNCRRSDRLRKQESRELRKNSTLTAGHSAGDIGDNGHESHPESPLVTPNLAKPKPSLSNKAPRQRDAELLPPVSLPEDWTPDAEANAVLVAETQRPVEVIMRQFPGFRDWWINGKGKGTRRKLSGWRTSWLNWVRNSAKRGQLDLAPLAPLALVPPADAEARARRAAEVEARAAAARQA